MTEDTTQPDDNSSFNVTMMGDTLHAPGIAYTGELRGDAIARIAELSKEGSAPTILSVSTEGLGRGLPKSVPLLWDRRTQAPISLINIIEEARPDMVRKGTAKAETLASFVALVNRHKGENSAIFAATKWPAPKLTAVIDYYTIGHQHDFGEHRVVYDFPLTEEIKAWIAGNGQEMDQVKFANFLEEHAAELASPMDGERQDYEPRFKSRFATPNELIDLSRSLEIHEGAKVKQGIRLQSGERQVIFTTEHTNAAGDPVDIPGLFMVAVPPFLAGDRPSDTIRIPARIRYRISGGAVSWFYDLYRWEFWLRERVQADLAFAAKETALPAYEGTPEMAG